MMQSPATSRHRKKAPFSSFFSGLFGTQPHQPPPPPSTHNSSAATTSTTTTTATSNAPSAGNTTSNHLPKPRKAPVKIEPKVFFANERTFLAWMHLSVILAGASIAIVALSSNDDASSTPVWSQIYGLLLLPVAMAFVVYSIVQYQRRSYMIRHRLPGPYEDTVGPVVLCAMLMVSIVVQFAVKLYALQQQD